MVVRRVCSLVLESPKKSPWAMDFSGWVLGEVRWVGEVGRWGGEVRWEGEVGRWGGWVFFWELAHTHTLAHCIYSWPAMAQQCWVLFLIHNGAKMNGTYIPLIVTPTSFTVLLLQCFPLWVNSKGGGGHFSGYTDIFRRDCVLSKTICVLSKTIYSNFPNLIKGGYYIEYTSRSVWHWAHVWFG